MKKYLILATIAIVAALAVTCILSGQKIERLTAKRDRHEGNTVALLFDVERYRVRDSLSAARAQSLELTVREYERFRTEDAALIKELKQRNRDLSAVNKTQSQTIINLQAIPRTIVLARNPSLWHACWHDKLWAKNKEYSHFWTEKWGAENLGSE